MTETPRVPSRQRDISITCNPERPGLQKGKMSNTGTPINVSGYVNLGDYDECPCGCEDGCREWWVARYLVTTRLIVGLTESSWYDGINPCVLEALHRLVEPIETICGPESRGVAGPTLALGYRLGIVLLQWEPSVGSLDVDRLADFGASFDMDERQTHGMPKIWGDALWEVFRHTTSADGTSLEESSPVASATLFGLESGVAVAWAEYVLLEERPSVA